MRVEHAGMQFEIVFDKYRGSGRLAVVLMSPGRVPRATLSTDNHDEKLRDDEFAVRDWGDNASLADACRDLFTDTGRMARLRPVPVLAPIWRVKHGVKYVVIWSSVKFGSEPMAVFDSMAEASEYQTSRQLKENRGWWVIKEVPYRP